MFYKRYTAKSDNPEWGGATYFFETDKTNLPVRQLVVYENGKIFGYDTLNRADEGGKLLDKPLFTDKKGRRDWQRRKIGKREFEKAWAKPDTVPTDPFADAIRAVHETAGWALVLGVLNLVVGPLLVYSEYNRAAAPSADLKHLAIAITGFNAAVGLFMIALATLLGLTKQQTLGRAHKLLLILILLIFMVPMLNLLAGGSSGSVGIFGLIVVAMGLRAQRKLLQINQDTSLAFRLAALGTVLVIVLIGAAILTPINRSVSGKAAPDQAAAKTAPAKRFVSLSADAALNRAATLNQAEQALQSFAAQYNLKVAVTDIAPSSYVQKNYTYDQLSAADLASFKAYGKLFMNEWAKYPTDWVQKSKLQSLVFVKDLAVSNAASISANDPQGQALYFDVSYGDVNAQAAIHVSFFNLVLTNDLGSPNAADATWMSFLPSDFSYGANTYCQNTQNTGACNAREHPREGFVDDFSYTSIGADKTETYAYLMTNSYHHDLSSWLPADKPLDNKVKYLVSFMASRSPEMQGSYFSAINP